MPEWTTIIPEKLRVKLFLDTNILSYLVDNTYPSLTRFIEELGKSPVCDLISSKYVIHEFMGIRKREHYLRKQVEFDTEGRILNISSLIKHKDSWSVPGKDFLECNNEVEENVKKDIQVVTEDFNIQYAKNLLHDDLIIPTMELCLNSKISKEDSLVACSSVHPEAEVSESVFLLTNDLSFHKQLLKAVEDGIFPKDLEKPQSIYLLDPLVIQKDSGEKVTVQLKEQANDQKIVDFVPDWIKSLAKTNPLYLGKVFNAEKPRANTVYFKLPGGKKLVQKIYVTVISKNFSGVYNVPEELSEFWNNGKISDYPFVKDEVSNIAIELKNDFFRYILEEGNLLFIHPDSVEL